MDAYSQGYQDCMYSYDLTHNPYTYGTQDSDQWESGWEDAASEFLGVRDYENLELLSGRFI